MRDQIREVLYFSGPTIYPPPFLVVRTLKKGLPLPSLISNVQDLEPWFFTIEFASTKTSSNS